MMAYNTQVIQDECTDGSLCYIAIHPEIDYCLAQGATIAEALAELAEVTPLFLGWLAESGLPIPLPFPARPGTRGADLTISLTYPHTKHLKTGETL